ncbi:hypothetical protein ACFL1S_01895 [Pseudomonadota bacterium]
MNMNHRLKLLRSAVWIVITIGSYCLIVLNAWPLANDLLNGDGSGLEMPIQPFYGFLRIPPSEINESVNASGHIAADFAQIYFPSSTRINSVDDNPKLDPWGQKSRYAPFLHYFCALTICKLDYGIASLIHVGVQYLLFIFSYFYAFKLLGVKSNLSFHFLVANCALLVTPVGLSFFERGQFSLYVGMAYLWFFLAFIRPNVFYAATAAICACVKLTSFPFLFFALFLFLVRSYKDKQAAQGIKLGATFTLTCALLFILFPTASFDYLLVLVEQELKSRAGGSSLIMFWPRWVVKLLPLYLVSFCTFLAWKNARFFETQLPLMIGIAVLLNLYPTIAFAYSVPSLIAFIPLLMWWKNLPGVKEGISVKIVVYGFYVFLFLALIPSAIPESLLDLWGISDIDEAYIYIVLHLCFGAVGLVATLLLSYKGFRPAFER